MSGPSAGDHGTVGDRRRRSPTFSGALRWLAASGIFAAGIAGVRHGPGSGADFLTNVWDPGRMLLHGGDPYDVAAFHRAFPGQGWMPLYSPVHLWLGLLWAALPARAAVDIWFVVNLAGIMALAAIAVRALGRGLGWPAVLATAGVLLLSRPGRGTVVAGQLTVFYTLPTYVAWSQARRRPWLAAVAAAIALGKPPFGLPLLALLAGRRLWGVVIRTLALFVLAAAPVAAWAAADAGSPRRLWDSVVGNLRYSDHSPVDRPGAVRRVDLVSLVARVWHVGAASEVVMFLGVMVGAVVVLRHVTTRPGWPVTPAVLVLLGTTTLLALSHQDYDLILLTWPVAAAWGSPWPDGRRCGPSRQVLGFAVVPLAVAALVPAATMHRVTGVSIAGVTSLTTVTMLLAAVAGAVAVAAAGRAIDGAARGPG